MENRILISASVILLLVASILVWQTWRLPASKTITELSERLTLLETESRQSLAPSSAPASAATIQTTQDGGQLQQLKTQIAKLETTLQALSKRTGIAKAAANYQPVQNQEQDPEQAAADQQKTLAAMLAQMDNRHAQQLVDPVWAEAQEDMMWSAYEQSLMQEGIELSTIDCRLDTCTLDFNLPPADGNFPPGHELEKWVFANAGDCGYTIEGSTSDEFDIGSTRRIWLHDCQ